MIVFIEEIFGDLSDAHNEMFNQSDEQTVSYEFEPDEDEISSMKEILM